MLISFILLFTTICINVFAQPLFSFVFGKSQSGERMVWTGMIILAALDLFTRIADLRKTGKDLNARLILPSGGGSFLWLPCWIPAFVAAFYAIVGF
ncbi:MAG TPA: hypothetical protein VK400_09005 [Pyrinomonadaceae bacterium]|nr:hypothetical protein [Pyrinomonadaceae bacterium]